ncbi:hypothetical protein SDC9_160825 [bioreactor metagenome]|uniref:Uncharacterized protein n=1 Tax=bioreactor metagenome TaxID=1076179 RepID=A0A645FM63_9ZZZZ
MQRPVGAAAAYGNVGSGNQVDIGAGRAERQPVNIPGIGIAYGKVCGIGGPGIRGGQCGKITAKDRGASGGSIHQLYGYLVELGIAGFSQGCGKEYLQLSGSGIGLGVELIRPHGARCGGVHELRGSQQGAARIIFL